MKMAPNLIKKKKSKQGLQKTVCGLVGAARVPSDSGSRDVLELELHFNSDLGLKWSLNGAHSHSSFKTHNERCAKLREADLRSGVLYACTFLSVLLGELYQIPSNNLDCVVIPVSHTISTDFWDFILSC